MVQSGGEKSQLPLWPLQSEGLRWSVSRHRRLVDCLRKYYYHDIASAGGWHADAPSETRHLYVLRGLRSRFMWVGEVVHSLIELALTAMRRREEVHAQALIERGTRMMRAQYAESLQGIYRDNPGQGFGLMEHEFGEKLAKEVWQGERQRMEVCVRNFFALPIVQQIAETPAWRWLALESVGSFELQGATVVVKPDFAWRDFQENVVLIDWKTGRALHDEGKLQLGAYAMFAQRAWGLRTERLRAQLVYLESGNIVESQLTTADLQSAEEIIVQSLAEFKKYSDHHLRIEDFPKTDDIQKCRHCAFRRLCQREQT